MAFVPAGPEGWNSVQKQAPQKRKKTLKVSDKQNAKVSGWLKEVPAEDRDALKDVEMQDEEAGQQCPETIMRLVKEGCQVGQDGGHGCMGRLSLQYPNSLNIMERYGVCWRMTRGCKGLSHGK